MWRPGSCPIIHHEDLMQIDSCSNRSTLYSIDHGTDTTKPVITFCPVDTTINSQYRLIHWPLVPWPQQIIAPMYWRIFKTDVKTNGSCPDNYHHEGPGRWSIVVRIKALAFNRSSVRNTTKLLGLPSAGRIRRSITYYRSDSWHLVPWPQQIIALMCWRISSRQMAKTNGSCPDNFTITRTWTVIDSCSNQSLHSTDHGTGYDEACDFLPEGWRSIVIHRSIQSPLVPWPQQIIATMCLRISSRQMWRPMVAVR